MFPFEFIFFGAILLGVMLFHEHHLKIAFGGLLIIVAYKFFFSEMSLGNHFSHETSLLVKLMALLVGFELMAGHFQESRLALKAPTILPDDWKGPFFLLCIIFTMSVFLDNIAAAIIGFSIARVVFKGKVSVGYMAAIVAASNAGGAGSVIGDTTTTMMWIDGVAPLDVTKAFIPALTALIVFGVFLSKAQQRYQPIVKDEIKSHGQDHARVDYIRVGIVFAMLLGVVVGNVFFEQPAIGLWIVIIASALLFKNRQPHWNHVPGAAINASFLLALVTAASLMPVEALPAASPSTTFALGAVSGVFDNIPLTKLALLQGGYDWGWLAFAVGYGGSMTWFGSSAGVALAKENPKFRNMKVFLKESWIIPVAYIVAFIPLILLGWEPHPPHK